MVDSAAQVHEAQPEENRDSNKARDNNDAMEEDPSTPEKLPPRRKNSFSRLIQETLQEQGVPGSAVATFRSPPRTYSGSKRRPNRTQSASAVEGLGVVDATAKRAHKIRNGEAFGGVHQTTLHRASSTNTTESILSYSSDDGNIRTDWEEGVAVIESILMPNSEAFSALSTAQVEGLRKVQQILLGGKNVNTSLHIPKGLLNDPTEPGSTSDFILRQYAGIKRLPVKKRVMNVITANRFINKLKIRRSSFAGLFSESRETHVLPEWMRLDSDAQVELTKLLSWENLSRWDFDIFKVHQLSNGEPLLFVGWAILSSPYSQWVMQESIKPEDDETESKPPTQMPGYNFPTKYKIAQETITNFLKGIEKEYLEENPYHNNIHAADVLQTLHALLHMGASEFATAELEIFSLLIAAVVHDMGHPGKNNAFQINSHSDLAIEYNDVSVLENMHVSRAFRKLLGQNMDPTMNIFQGFSDEQRNTSRKMIIESILDTDMTKHFSTVNKIKGIRLGHKELSGLKDDDAWQILHYCLHMADISNPSKPLEVSLQWTDRCLEEFFLQGDLEKRMGLPVSPLCDRMTTQRANSQIGFIKFVVQPAFEMLAKLVPGIETKVLPILEGNLQHWIEEQRKADASAMEDGTSGNENDDDDDDS